MVGLQGPRVSEGRPKEEEIEKEDTFHHSWWILVKLKIVKICRLSQFRKIPRDIFCSSYTILFELPRLSMELLQNFGCCGAACKFNNVHCRTSQKGVKRVTRCLASHCAHRPLQLQLKSPVSLRVVNSVSSCTSC